MLGSWEKHFHYKSLSKVSNNSTFISGKPLDILKIRNNSKILNVCAVYKKQNYYMYDEINKILTLFSTFNLKFNDHLNAKACTKIQIDSYVIKNKYMNIYTHCNSIVVEDNILNKYNSNLYIYLAQDQAKVSKQLKKHFFTKNI